MDKDAYIDQLVFDNSAAIDALAEANATIAALRAELDARPRGYLDALDARDRVLWFLYRIAAMVDVPINAPLDDIAAAVERLVAAQGWQPVTEKPHGSGRYRVIYEGEEQHAGYSSFADVWLWDDDDDPMTPQPSHWQPIPPGPKRADEVQP